MAQPEQVALDIACGRGRHAIALHAKGYTVVALDIARAALARPELNSRSGILPVQADVECWPFRSASFDVIVQYDFLDRGAFAAIRRALIPGGLLLIDTFLAVPEGINGPGPRNPAFRLAPGELARTFADWEILRLAEQPGDAFKSARAAILVRRSR